MNNDLISRSALLENYGLKNAVKYGNETAEQQHNSYSTLMLYEIADMINDAPAVDAEVVRHGRWEYYPPKSTLNGFHQCSVCLHFVFDSPAKEFERHKYCPNCGAKMDGDERD